MDWLDEVKNKIKKKNQILFAQDSEYLQDVKQLIDEQNHKTIVLWALEYADETAQVLEERYPNESRPKNTVATVRRWAEGKLKMPEAQRAILQVHAMAKKIASAEDVALCHAVGQACGTVHTEGHAMGIPLYDLTSLVRKYGVDACREPVEQRKQYYVDRIVYWKDAYQDTSYEWADFMEKEKKG